MRRLMEFLGLAAWCPARHAHWSAARDEKGRRELVCLDCGKVMARGEWKAWVWMACSDRPELVTGSSGRARR